MYKKACLYMKSYLCSLWSKKIGYCRPLVYKDFSLHRPIRLTWTRQRSTKTKNITNFKPRSPNSFQHGLFTKYQTIFLSNCLLILLSCCNHTRAMSQCLWKNLILLFSYYNSSFFLMDICFLFYFVYFFSQYRTWKFFKFCKHCELTYQLSMLRLCTCK